MKYLGMLLGNGWRSVMHQSLRKCYHGLGCWLPYRSACKGVRFFFASGVAWFVNFTTRAYAPTDHVLFQLNMIHQVALNLST